LIYVGFMESLLEKLGQKKRKPILRETTLTDDDLVHLYPGFDSLYLIRNGYLYRVKEKFSEIDSSAPKVSTKYFGEPTKGFLRLFQPYRELRSSS